MGKIQLLSNALHTFWEGGGRQRVLRGCLMPLLFICAMVATRTANAQITIDGDPNDWPAGVFSNPAVVFKTFVVDSFNTDNDDVYTTGGSKDVNDIPFWRWEEQAANDKTDMENAGMALIGSRLYFFGDHYANVGAASIGIWILKNEVNKLPLVAGVGEFSGVHADGDVLVTTDLAGGHPERHVYVWTAGALVEITLSTAAFDIAVNDTDVNSPWPYTPKAGTPGVYPESSFMEGFVDLDSLGVSVDFCFTEFFMSTRTSQSTSAQLEDLVRGLFATRPVVTVANDTVCAGQAAVFIAHTIGGLAPITWSWNGGAFAGDSTFTINPATVNTVVTVVAHGSNGCLSEPDTAQLVVKPSPSIDAISSVSYCNGEAGAAITFSSTPPGASFSWTSSANVGFGTSGTGSIGSYTATNTGTTPVVATVSVTATAEGCPGSPTTFNVTVNPTPTVVANDTSICAGVSFSLNLLSDPDGGTWTGTGVSGTTFNSAGLSAGAHGLSYTFTDLNGCTNSDSAYVTILVNPTVVARDTAICAGVSFSLNLLSDPDGGTWSGTGVSGTTFNSAGLAPGTYGLLYTFSSGAGCSGSDSAYITINANPTVVARDTAICAGVSFSLNLLSDPDGGTWSGTGVSGTTFNSAGLSAGAHGLLYTYTNANGCSASDSAYVTINSLPVVTAGDTSICAGNSVNLNLLSDPDGGTWTGTGVSGTTFNSAGLSAGVYGLLYTYTNGNGCTSSDSAYITVLVNPTVVARDTAICAGVSFSLNLLSDPDGGTWSGTGVSGTTFNSAGLAPGIYGLLYTFSSGAGCSGSDSAYVTITPKPVIPNLNNITVCSGGAVGLINITGGDIVNTFSWTATLSVGFGTSGTGNINAFAAIINNGPGNIVATVNVTAASTAGCTDTKSFTITVQPKPVVVARDTTVCAGTSLNLVPIGSPAGGTWSGPGVSGNTFNNGTPGTYKIYYTVNSGGCTGYDSAYICVTQCCVVYGTYTQGIWSSCNITLCDGKSNCGGRKTPVQLINYLLSSGQITVGRPGRSVVIPTYAAATVNAVLPGSWGANKLTYAGNVTISNVAGSLFAVNYLSGGKVNNSLLGEQIAMKLNIRMTPGLVNFPITYTPAGDSYFQTFQANEVCCKFTCSDMCPICFKIKKSVAKYLTKGGTQAANLNSLVNLADDLLGGVVTPGQTIGGYIVPTYADVAAALGTVSSAFNYFRTFNGVYGCGAAKGAIASGTTPQEPLTIENQTRIYPNPTSGRFTIEVPMLEKDAHVTVMDMNGRSILSTTLSANPYEQKVQLEMPDVARGMYFIRIESDGKIFAKKLMLE